MSDPVFFMIEEHPTQNLIRIQVNNNFVLLNPENQEKVYKYLIEKFGE